ncbi:hypothetical protein SAMN05421640_0912 [Ekhidna lutea]|uniref:Uncharacterized protein n=1 Tax=Ekhidna lutea TaxID=447679 RepID=A0A239GLX5_EKHLU|nr:hypothetical protein [Ekhidna lutea]SNS70157.1 hypothetical protein SAMN05421640_0912 [Ekhidna lutea]
MEITKNQTFEKFEESFKAFQEASDLTKREHASKLASQIDILSLSEDGISYLYKRSVELDEQGLFSGTSWAEPTKLIPTLVKGTLLAGHPSSSFEIVSDLRLLAYAKGAESNMISQPVAKTLLEEVLVHNLEFALNDLSEDTRQTMSEREVKKAINLFSFLLSETPIEGIYEKLALEVDLICSQRPVETRKARELIRLIDQRFQPSGESKHDQLVRTFINALKAPTTFIAKERSTPEAYIDFIQSCSADELKSEAIEMGESMVRTGLVSQYHAYLLLYLVKDNHALVPACLGLNERGSAEWEKFKDIIVSLISEIVTPNNYQCIYGLSWVLGRNLLSRRPVRAGLENLRRAKINPQVEKRILKSIDDPDSSVTALQYLLGGTLKVLGQPLGVGQGNNPTCQSARGISMWSQHAPAKLIDMIITVATQNNLIMRFENQDLESIKLGKGLVEKLDFNLDVVSAILVPHLDRIYNEMMKRSMGRADDPHRWVNPAMYGHWIPVGFASCYDYTSNSILDFEGFIRIFYAAFHPLYNDNNQVLYPIPVGIYVTSNHGDMLGFHAISLLRVDKDPSGDYRAYFLNPNNEGRQDWGQDIKPSVHENGEKAGESSLPFHQFAARIYAFHYNSLEATAHLHLVEDESIQEVKKLAQESWGKSYNWIEQPKLW